MFIISETIPMTRYRATLGTRNDDVRILSRGLILREATGLVQKETRGNVWMFYCDVGRAQKA